MGTAVSVNFGVSIFLIAVGAILTFAVKTSVQGIDINIVGWILMAVGAFGLLLTLILYGRRSRAGYRNEIPPRDPPLY
jgi:hypothetical protein